MCHRTGTSNHFLIWFFYDEVGCVGNAEGEVGWEKYIKNTIMFGYLSGFIYLCR